MAMESVKMGRIPKRLKEKALRDYEQQRDKDEHYERKSSNEMKTDENSSSENESKIGEISQS